MWNIRRERISSQGVVLPTDGVHPAQDIPHRVVVHVQYQRTALQPNGIVQTPDQCEDIGQRPSMPTIVNIGNTNDYDKNGLSLKPAKRLCVI